MVKSVYIHIPFCKRICSYCDFCKIFYNEELVDNYLLSLEKEIKDRYKGEVLKTIYIGGGTPSSLNIEELNKLFSITSLLSKDNDVEFTIEFNIEDINEEKLLLCKNNGINRLSIGVQSFNKKNLDYLNRRTDIDIIDKIQIAKKYFDNINIDLIYGLENQSIKDLEEDLDMFLKLDIPHISCYSLIIEEHTMLFNKNVKPINDEIDYDMYRLINNKLNNYNHYEISNYSKEGYESKHNLTYWNNEEYYGFGVSSASYLDNKRINASKSINNYIRGIYNYEEETLDIKDKMSYELILGFRKTNGIDISEFYNKYNVDITSLYNVKELLKDKKLIIENNRIFVNKEYLYLENEILLNFV